MARRGKPTLIQIETQGRLTMALLPLVAALPFLDDETLARIFGQAMSIINWAHGMRSAMTAPLEMAMLEIDWRQPPKSKEEQRAYWRDAKRAERNRKRES